MPTPQPGEDEHEPTSRHVVPLRGAADALPGGTPPKALAHGIRTSLRENATAYGFSVSITAAFGLVSTQQPSKAALPVLLFAASAALTFIVVEVVVSKFFRHIGSGERTRVVLISGAVDGLSILCAVSAAIGLSRVPGVLAWPATAAGTVLVFLVVGGLDVLIARRLATAVGDGED